MAEETLHNIVTHSPEETIAFGQRLAGFLKPPCIVLLEGDLGSGKTMLVKGIAAGLGAAAQDEVTSPSFTLVHQYGGGLGGLPGMQSKPGVVHVDLYRIENPREIESLGLDEFFSGNSTVLIEWGERLPQPPPGRLVRIRIETAGEFERRIVVENVFERAGPA
ncbi:MAG: tRNA (adenosine(37)-N6)-threonylcarbamoyltransferase complex ATPase subunit type 1 TsaE [Terriglobia bacterium]